MYANKSKTEQISSSVSCISFLASGGPRKEIVMHVRITKQLSNLDVLRWMRSRIWARTLTPSLFSESAAKTAALNS